MPETKQDIEELVAGDTLTWQEFEARWDAMPELKRAELIGGIVYIMSPVSLPHEKKSVDATTWLRLYAHQTAGCQCAGTATWRMLEDAPQPDVALRIVEECGGKSHFDGKYAVGAPELVVEVCHSSSAFDLHLKKDLYHRAAVDEYLAVLLREREVRWHRWEKKGYVLVPLPADGIQRSHAFPGLWLDVPAFVQDNFGRVLEVLQLGLQSPEHARFVQKLALRKEKR